MKIGYAAITWGDLVGTAGGVTSVAQSFYRTNGSIAHALRDIAASGYSGVEIFDGNVVEQLPEPAQLRDLLEETKLELVSVYTGANFIYDSILPEELNKIERAAEAAIAFGAKHLVIGGGAQRTSPSGSSGVAENARADIERLAIGLNLAAEIAHAAGLGSSYHPHLGTLVETPASLDMLMEMSTIGFCPDTAHIAGGGGDPAEVIRKYGHRLTHVHLKDWDYATSTFRPLGQGQLDFPDILLALHEEMYNDWVIVELDSFDGHPADAARQSGRYLDEAIASLATRSVVPSQNATPSASAQPNRN